MDVQGASIIAASVAEYSGVVEAVLAMVGVLLFGGGRLLGRV